MADVCLLSLLFEAKRVVVLFLSAKLFMKSQPGSLFFHPGMFLYCFITSFATTRRKSWCVMGKPQLLTAPRVFAVSYSSSTVSTHGWPGFKGWFSKILSIKVVLGTLNFWLALDLDMSFFTALMTFSMFSLLLLRYGLPPSFLA